MTNAKYHTVKYKIFGLFFLFLICYAHTVQADIVSEYRDVKKSDGLLYLSYIKEKHHDGFESMAEYDITPALTAMVRHSTGSEDSINTTTFRENSRPAHNFYISTIGLRYNIVDIKNYHIGIRSDYVDRTQRSGGTGFRLTPIIQSSFEDDTPWSWRALIELEWLDRDDNLLHQLAKRHGYTIPKEDRGSFNSEAALYVHYQGKSKFFIETKISLGLAPESDFGIEPFIGYQFNHNHRFGGFLSPDYYGLTYAFTY